jgi:hypothetical protein
MPTIIDSLLVTLGIQDNATAKIPAITRKLKDVDNENKNISKSTKEVNKGLTDMAGSAMKFLAVIGGTAAIKTFIVDLAESNSQLQRLSQNLGVGVSTISAWSQAAEQIGGSASGVQGTLAMLSKAQTEFTLTGQSGLIPFLSALGMGTGALTSQKPDQLLLGMADAFERIVRIKGRATANNMGQMMGIDQGTMNLLLTGRKELELTLRRQKESNAVTAKQAEEAVKLKKSIEQVKQTFAAFGRDLLQQAAPAIEKILALLLSFGNWVRANQESVVMFLKLVTVGLGALALAAMPINLTVLAIIGLAAAIALLWQDYETWKRGGDSLIDWGKWEPGIKFALGAMEALKNGLVGLYEAYTRWYERVTGHKFSDDFTAGIQAIGNVLGIRGKNLSAKQMQEFFQKLGWTPEQSAGIAANLMRESQGNTNALGDHGQAVGLAQWHPDRQATFKRVFGKDLRDASPEEQMAFVNWELTQGPERNAGNQLRGAKNASDASSIVSRLYERPEDASGQASARGAYAQSLMGVAGAGNYTAGLMSYLRNPANASSDQSRSLQIGEVKVYTAATDAPGIAKDMKQSLEWQFASQANSGLN